MSEDQLTLEEKHTFPVSKKDEGEQREQQQSPVSVLLQLGQYIYCGCVFQLLQTL